MARSPRRRRACPPRRAQPGSSSATAARRRPDLEDRRRPARARSRPRAAPPDPPPSSSCSGVDAGGRAPVTARRPCCLHRRGQRRVALAIARQPAPDALELHRRAQRRVVVVHRQQRRAPPLTELLVEAVEHGEVAVVVGRAAPGDLELGDLRQALGAEGAEVHVRQRAGVGLARRHGAHDVQLGVAGVAVLAEVGVEAHAARIRARRRAPARRGSAAAGSRRARSPGCPARAAARRARRARRSARPCASTSTVAQSSSTSRIPRIRVRAADAVVERARTRCSCSSRCRPRRRAPRRPGARSWSTGRSRSAAPRRRSRSGSAPRSSRRAGDRRPRPTFSSRHAHGTGSPASALPIQVLRTPLVGAITEPARASRR